MPTWIWVALGVFGLLFVLSALGSVFTTNDILLEASARGVRIRHPRGNLFVPWDEVPVLLRAIDATSPGFQFMMTDLRGGAALRLDRNAAAALRANVQRLYEIFRP